MAPPGAPSVGCGGAGAKESVDRGPVDRGGSGACHRRAPTGGAAYRMPSVAVIATAAGYARPSPRTRPRPGTNHPVKAAAIAFAVSAACTAVLSIVQFANGHPGLGLVWLVVTAGWVGVTIFFARTGTSGPPPV